MGKGEVCARESCPVSSILRTFKGGDFRGSSRGGSQQNIHQLSRYVLSGSWPWSLQIGQCQSRESLVTAVVSDVSHGIALPGVAAFLGLPLKHS